MKRYPTFVFDSYRLDAAAQRIDLVYRLENPEDEITFTESIHLPAPVPEPLSPAVDRALFALHLIGGVSYYKTCLPPSIAVRSGTLTEAQAGFWNTVYERGLGEFFFQNDIDFRGLIRFPHAERAPEPPALSAGPVPERPRVLVPVGGGKDSVVTIELLKEAGAECTLFRSGAHPLVDAVAEITGLPMLTVERRLSPTLFRLNAEGALNGHVPVTAYLSFLTVLLSLLYGFDLVAMSNERSASEGNVQFHGVEVNHQWSKSLEFESAFAEYVRRWVTGRVEYASLLRPLSELHIAELFARHPQYFDAATSCNNNWKIARRGAAEPGRAGEGGGGSRWCGHCPKCTFAFALMAAFLPEETVLRMFGKNLFADEALLPLYRKLLGVEGFKPFECVGTPEETQAAFYRAERHGRFAESAVMRMFRAEALPNVPDPERRVREALTPSPEHRIPEPLYTRLASRW